MPYYPIMDLSSMKPQEGGGGKMDVLLLRGEDGFILPVFTTLGRFWAFVDKYYAGDDSVQATTVPMDPFKLAEMIMSNIGGEPTCEALVFNPVAFPAREWRSTAKPIPISEYCRFISEIRPGLKKLAKEAKDKFGHLPDPIAFEEGIRWSKPLLEEVARNASARVKEWEVRDDS